MTKLKQMSAEAKGNVVVICFFLAFLFVMIITIILSATGIYKADVRPYAIPAVLFACVPTAILLVSIYKTKGTILDKHWLKYFLLLGIVLLTGVFNIMAFFHTTILLMMPLLFSFVYRSFKFNILVVISTMALIISTPILSYSLNGMEISFPAWYLSILAPSYLSEEGHDVVASLNGITSPCLGLLIYVSLPRILMVTVMVVLVEFTTRLNRKSHARKIKQVYDMQNAILDGMSEVIENRDSFTGGHVKRARDAVSILVEVAKEEFSQSDEYWQNVINAAAMHDVGKIAVSDVILTKPAKLTTEEFNEIKKHPGKSVEIIESVLGKVESEDFLKVAKNMAKYHHEKYNGTGYPEGLIGDEIPLEARIMAIADVFDALVSKRVYKEPYSFEDSYKIIIDSMGSHFDPKLIDTFRRAYPKLMEMYKNLAE